MVAVNELVFLGEILGALLVQKQGAAGIGFSVEVPVQIFEIIRSLHHRMVHMGSVQCEPSGHIGINLPQSREIPIRHSVDSRPGKSIHVVVGKAHHKQQGQHEPFQHP